MHILIKWKTKTRHYPITIGSRQAYWCKCSCLAFQTFLIMKKYTIFPLLRSCWTVFASTYVPSWKRTSLNSEHKFFYIWHVYHVTLVCLPSFPSFFINFLLKVALLSVIITIWTGVCCKECPSKTYKLDSRPTWHRKNCHFRSDCISHGQTRPGASRSNFIFPICISFCYYTYDYKFFCQVLVCAPSNVAVDQLAEKISATGLKVMKKSFCLQLC